MAVMAAVISSFILSYAFTLVPFFKDISGGTKTIILTILISAVIAIIKPVEDDETDVKQEISEATNEQ